MANSKNVVDLSVIKSKETKELIKKICQDENPIGDGLRCPHCGCMEAYKNRKEPGNTKLWAFMIRAFRVDDASECRNCGKWFNL